MENEVRVALQVCKDLPTVRGLTMALITSLAFGQDSLNFGLKLSKEERDLMVVELLKQEFDPYAHATLPSDDGKGVLFDRAPRNIVPFLHELRGNAFKTRDDYQSTVFLQKWKGLRTKQIDPEVEAKKSFWISEADCFKTNRRFTDIITEVDGPAWLQTGLYPSPILDVLVKARKYFRDTLGPIPRLDQLELRLGPGSVFEKQAVYGVDQLTAIDKLDNTPFVTTSALDLFYEIWKDTSWFREWYPRSVSFNLPLYTVSDYERFFCVPKNAKTHRGCALGPSGNIALQLAIARPMRARLNRVGLLLKPIDIGLESLNFAPFDKYVQKLRPVREGSERIHHLLAQRASCDENAATVDQSRASDSVACQLVKFLASPRWFELLDGARCKKILIDFDKDGNTCPQYAYLTSRFSAMGNGFTFELETLIFYSLARAVCDEHEIVSVYGDDVILPKDRVSDFNQLLRFCGFTPNSKKTFVSGPFRESCGGDFLHGQNIRPYYCKETINEPAHSISLANGLYRSRHRHNPHGTLRLKRAWLTALAPLPKQIKELRGPVGLGDCVIHDDEYSRYALAPKGWRAAHKLRRDGVTYVVTQQPAAFKPFNPEKDSNRYYRGWLTTPLKRKIDRYDPGTQFAAALYGVASDGVAPRGAATSSRISIFEHG